MADSRLRKRSTRLSELDPLAVEEPPKKKARKRDAPAVGRPKRHRGESSSTPPSKPGVKGRGGSSLKEVRRGKRLLVSLNIQDNDLHVSRQVEGGGKGGGGTPRPRGRGRQANQQRDPSVVSDSGSNNGGMMNGKALGFKNPNFSVSE